MRKSRLVLLGALFVAAQSHGQVPVDAVTLDEGFWYDPERPGTGLSIERRGEVLAVALYHFGTFSEGDDYGSRQEWLLGTTSAVAGGIVVPMQRYVGGSLVNAEPYQAAVPEGEPVPLALELHSPRELTARLGEGEARRLVAVPFGVDYPNGDVFDPALPVPSLLGRWIVSPASQPLAGGVLDFQAYQFEVDFSAPPMAWLRYRGEGSLGATRGAFEMACGESDQVCRLQWEGDEAATLVLRPGGIGEDRFLAEDAAGGQVRGWRVDDAQVQP